jgi:hypothetical protein
MRFSQLQDRPPHLLEFKGSVAERHAENLKIIRAIGAKKYIEACRDLTPGEILLRQKVYNFFNGPGALSLLLNPNLTRLLLLAFESEGRRCNHLVR